MTNSTSNNPTANEKGTSKDLVEERLSAWLAEYKALRTEMEWLIKDGAQYQNFALTLLGIALAAIGWITQKAPNLIIPTLLSFPFLFCLLGFLFLRQHEEVYVVAAYLKEYVRPKVRSLLEDNDLWGWEEFKSRKSEELCKSGSLKSFSTNKMIVVLRMVLFVVPSLISLGSVTVYSALQGFCQLFILYGRPLSLLFIICYLFDLIVFLFLLISLITRTDLSKRLKFS